MSRYRFELADQSDDADLRHVLANTPMPGRISVTFLREPSYFDSATVDGRFRQVVAARDTDSRRVVGFGSRSVTDRYVNGLPAAVGYLSTLRLLPAHQYRGLVARGYRFFRDLHSDRRAALYLTTIAQGNRKAVETLTSARADLPAYHFAGLYHTFAVPLRPGRRGPVHHDLTIRPACENDERSIVEFLKRFGPRRQFFPCYESGDLFESDGPLAHLRPADLMLAFRGDELLGMLGAWNQHSFRQTIVQAYAPRLRFARPLYNLIAKMTGAAVLPAPGQPFRYLLGALPVVADDNPQVFAALLAAHKGRSQGGEADHLLIGLHEDDPLLPVLNRHRWTRYTTCLYLVCWEDGEPLRGALDNRCPYLELGCL